MALLARRSPLPARPLGPAGRPTPSRSVACRYVRGSGASEAPGAGAGAKGVAAGEPPAFPFSRPSGGQPPEEYARLRRECPVFKAKLWDGAPLWLVTKMSHAKAMLTDDRMSKVRTHPGFPELSPGAKAAIEGREATFVDMDAPDHMKFRSMFEPAFSRERVEALRPSIARTVESLLDEMDAQMSEAKRRGGRAHLDLHECFSMPVAFRTIYDILGAPHEDFKLLSGNVGVRGSGSSTARDANAAQQEIVDYMGRLVDKRIADGGKGDDAISAAVRGPLQAGDISRDQLVAHAFLLLVAGNATVASMINLGLYELLAHPDQLAALRADIAAGSPKGLLKGAVEEMCRFHTASALALRRVATADTEVGGVVIPAGEGAIALNMSANRDEDVWEDPDSFNIARPIKPNMAYGYGPHECIARALSLAELEAAFAGLLPRFPGIKLAVEPTQLEWSQPTRDVGLKALPVTW